MKFKVKILGPSPLGIALAGSLVLSVSALAQDDKTQSVGMSSSSNAEHDAEVHSRFWVGAYGSASPFTMFSVGTHTDAAGNYYKSTSANGIVGAGLNFNLRFTSHYWLNVGAVYHYGGYDTNTSLNDSNATNYAQRTRAKMFDFPIMVRYAGPKWRWSKYSFYELGGALRYAESPQQSYSASDVNGFYCCAPPSTDSYKKLIGGVAIGTGLVAKDDFGIKVAPEVRYIRWLGDTFHSSTVGTMRDQLEVGISFGF